MGEIVISLLEPLALGGGEQTDKVVLREPTGREYFEIGEPIQYQRVKDGSEKGTVVSIEVDSVISAYLKKLVVKPDIPSLLGNLGLADSIRVKDALLDFFGTSQVRARAPAGGSSDA